MASEIIDKIRKLHHHAESAKKVGSEKEAKAFAKEVQRLLEKHNLELSDIELQEEIDNIQQGLLYRDSCWWEQGLATMLAQFNGGEIVISSSDDHLILVATPTNMEAISYLFHKLRNFVEYARQQYSYQHLKQSWTKGFSMGIYQQLELSAEQEALIRINEAVQEKCQQWADDTHEIAPEDHHQHDPASYLDGLEEGRNANLSEENHNEHITEST